MSNTKEEENPLESPLTLYSLNQERDAVLNENNDNIIYSENKFIENNNESLNRNIDKTGKEDHLSAFGPIGDMNIRNECMNSSIRKDES